MNLVNLNLNNPLIFYGILSLTALVELYAFYVLKRQNFMLGIPAFVFVGVMHSFLFITKGLAHTHAIYHVITILLVTLLGIHDHEKIDNMKMTGIAFAVLSIFFMEFNEFKKVIIN